MTVDLCRDPLPHPASPAAPCSVVRRLKLPPGSSTASDDLPAALLAEPPAALAYRVRLPNATGRDAGASNLALAASGPSPQPVTGLQARSVPTGVELTWNAVPLPPGTETELLRTATATRERSALRSLELPAVRSKSGPPAGPKLRRATPPPGTKAIHLLAGSVGQPDPGGAVDASVVPDHSYTYSVVRTRSVAFSGTTLILRSADSPAVTLLVRDLTPPPAPAELLAATDGLVADLSWQPGFQPDLAGYVLERTELPREISVPSATATWQRLNPVPLPAPAFHDVLPHPGRFVYRVSAVDTSGNQGPASPPLVVDAQQPGP